MCVWLLSLWGVSWHEQKEAVEAGDWLAGKRKEQEGRGAAEGPAMMAREIRAKREALQVRQRAASSTHAFLQATSCQALRTIAAC